MIRATLLVLSFLFLFLLEAAAADKRFLIEFDRIDLVAEKMVERVGGRVVHRFPEYKVVSASLSEVALQRLKGDLHVRRIEPDPERYLMSETIPYGVPMVQADLVNEQSAGNLKVCIIDSGFQSAHEDLQDTRLSGVVIGDSGNALEDRCGHGSHVAGIIAALKNDVGVLGVLPGNHVRLHIVKIFGVRDCRLTYTSDLVDAVRRCRNAGSHVINMSLGGATPSGFEEMAFDDAYEAGILPVAAAGNDGDGSYSYPASYNSVVSVAAINSKGNIASFSQRNDEVEFAAPGVDVLSTVPYVETNTVTNEGKVYRGNWLENAARSQGVTGNLVNGGLCKNASASWKEKVVLCKRGEILFRTKVNNVQAARGVAAVIYNNIPGNFSGTLGEGAPVIIPAISLSKIQGEFLLDNGLRQEAKVASQRKQPASGYERSSGTSMATPHVAGVAALIWSYNPQWTNAQIRQGLQATAKDLGPIGKDDSYGYGLPQAKAALDWLQAQSTTTPNTLK